MAHDIVSAPHLICAETLGICRRNGRPNTPYTRLLINDETEPPARLSTWPVSFPTIKASRRNAWS